MTLPEKMQVVIYDAPQARSGECACGCGGHHHQGEEDSLAAAHLELQSRALALTLEAAFPGKVAVEYINVLQDPRGADLPQAEILRSQTLPSPLVYINGQGRFAGALPAERIREEVGKLLEN